MVCEQLLRTLIIKKDWVLKCFWPFWIFPGFLRALKETWTISDLSAVRRLMSNDSTPLLNKSGARRFGENFCPSCRMPFDKAKKRRLVDTCGHERCYACMFRNETCPICIATGEFFQLSGAKWAKSHIKFLYMLKDISVWILSIFTQAMLSAPFSI